MRESEIKQKMKLPLLVIVLMVLVVGGTIFSIYLNSQVYDFELFQIKKTTLNALSSEVGEEFIICSIKDDACAKLGKLE